MTVRTITVGFAASACLTLAPAYAAPAPRPPAAAQHVHTPKPAGKPPTPGARGTTTTPTAPSTHTSTSLNPIAAKIAAKPQFNAKVTALLPQGTTLNQASMGFKNQGQFVAALHVSRNLGIPFADLQKDMTGAKHLSLGQSIQDLRPSANAKTEAHKAEAAADEDVKSTASTSPTSTSGKSRKTPTGGSR